MVVGGEVVTLKNIEDSSSLVIAEMPINVSSLLLSSCIFTVSVRHGEIVFKEQKAVASPIAHRRE